MNEGRHDEGRSLVCGSGGRGPRWGRGVDTITQRPPSSGAAAIVVATNALEASTLYAVPLPPGFEDVVNNTCADAVEWSFITVGAGASIEPVDRGTAADFLILAITAVTLGANEVTQPSDRLVSGRRSTCDSPTS